MTLPPRLQIKRVKGSDYRARHSDAINCKRFWNTGQHRGNPWTVEQAQAEHPGWTKPEARRHVVTLFAQWLNHEIDHQDPAENQRREWILATLPELTGHPLGCSCDLPAPGETDWCHAAVLIRRANPGSQS